MLFKRHVADLCTIIADIVNPFSVFDSRDIVNKHVIQTMRNIERDGQEQYSHFCC